MALGIPASLACPDAERLALAHEATRWLAARSGAQAAFLSGGLMSGLGTPTSDFDVYLVETADASPARRQLSIDKTIRVDVHEVPRLELERVVDQLTADRPHDDETAFLCSTAELKLATRLYAAEIVAGAAIVTPLRDRLRSGHHLRRHVLQSWLTSAHSDLEDFAGLRASGDLDAAAMVGREALIAGGRRSPPQTTTSTWDENGCGGSSAVLLPVPSRWPTSSGCSMATFPWGNRTMASANWRPSPGHAWRRRPLSGGTRSPSTGGQAGTAAAAPPSRRRVSPSGPRHGSRHHQTG
ncbi:hypothetical protein ACFQ0B_79860 [Nonomuraea thailandensis]